MFFLVQRLRDWLSTRAEHVLLAILAAGPVPQHVAFVMDGNRRYARRKRQKVIQGHMEGFMVLKRASSLSHIVSALTQMTRLSYLLQILEACLRLNVRCVTAYAFSIENFSRPQEEVDGLLSLAEEKLSELTQNG
jgi:ditrans,polycis-polyprenyl diphosphate synthase